MTSEENFRSRSQSVRQAARAHMLEIRRARTSKHAAATRPDVPVVHVSVPASHVAVTQLADGAVLKAGALLPEVAEPAKQAAAAVPPDIAEDTDTEIRADAVAAVAPIPGDPSGVPTGTESSVADDLEAAAVASAALAEPSQDQVRVDEMISASSSAEPRKPGRKSANGGSDGAVAVRKTAVKKPKPPSVPEAAPDEGSSALKVAVAELADAVSPADLPAAEWPEMTGSRSDEPLAEEQLPVPAEAAIALADHADIAPQPSELHIASYGPAPRGDLLDLPGAGPGLIWMLEQCSVATMQELADTDAAELSRKLGLVGQILNVKTWVDFARTQISETP